MAGIPVPERAAKEIQEPVKALPLSRKVVVEKAVRLQFWVPGSLRRSLAEEATKNGMTVAAWTAYVLAKRPEKVVEKTFLPAGTKKLFEDFKKRVAEGDGALVASKAKVAEWEKWAAFHEAKEALSGRKLTMALKVLEDLKPVKCPACKKTVQVNFTDDLKRIRDLK